jgi:hypothetical protein
VLVDVDLGSGATQSGAAVLGATGDKWNAVSGTTSTIVNSANSSLSGVGLTLTSYGVFTDTGGTAMDSATTPLMEDYAFGYSSTPDVTVTMTGLSAYNGASFTLVVYAAGDAAGQGASLSLTSGATGGNTGSTLVASATSRKISAGSGVAYVTYTGTITGGNLTFVAAPLSGQAFTVMNGFQLQISAPQPPAITAVSTQSTYSGQAANLQISATDPQGQTLSYSATGLPTGLTINSTTGLISGTVSTSAAASNSVTVTVSDGTLSSTTSFTWTIKTPYSGGTVLVDVDLGSSATQSGAAVLGATGDKWNAVSGTTSTIVNSANSSLSGVGLTLTSYGVYTDTGGTAMDSATTPLMEDYAFGYSSTPDVTVTLTGLSAYNGASFTLVVYAAGDNAGQGASVSLTSGATGGNTGSTLVASATSRKISAGSGVAYVTYTGTITGGNLTFVAAPLSGQSFTVMNGFQLQISAPQPPTITAVAAQNTAIGQSVSLQISATDPQGQTLTYSATGLPAGLTINSATGLITGTVSTSAAATNSVTVYVNDIARSSSTSFTWTTHT